MCSGTRTDGCRIAWAGASGRRLRERERRFLLRRKSLEASFFVLSFLPAVGLRCCGPAFSGWGKQGPLLSCGAPWASPVAEHKVPRYPAGRLQPHRLSSCVAHRVSAPWHVESSGPRSEPCSLVYFSNISDLEGKSTLEPYYQFILKGYNSGTAEWKRCTERESLWAGFQNSCSLGNTALLLKSTSSHQPRSSGFNW